ncbi:Rab guanine nucleotide exchange factor sec2 [Penicillium rolfsii]|nr:Rab guanine nucleotide exchange factor sec2 [Penicillium rolfsii]
MADLIAFQTYHHSKLRPPSSTMIPRHAHKRSLSSEHRGLSPDRTVTKAKSTTNLSDAATQQQSKFEETNFNTLRDPRLIISSEDSSSTSSSHHPDLSSEVAALSVKLIQAINNQTTLDDNLAATRQELEAALGKIQALEFQNEKYRRDIAEKVYIKKADADIELMRLRGLLAEECAQRSTAEKAKKTMEQELETLTADLFEEANKMVAAAKIEREAVEKKNEQLRSQIKDTESLLASHQDQLAELKSVIQGMHLAKDDLDIRTNISTAPPSPAGPPQLPGSSKQELEFENAAPTCNSEELVPGPTCNFPEMIRLVCRTDLQAYEDFRELLTLPRSSKPPSRAGSGSYAGLNVMSLASFATGGSASATSSPTKGITNSPNGSITSQTGSHIPLKETRFYKRVLMEDIEPTLRLDLAPGISWLTRRTVLSGICEGTLIVEPIPPASKKFEFPCSTCGERRLSPEYERTHRFRTSDSETAQRYSLCIHCLERVRSCCEFTGYLRLILDGHLRAGDADEEKEIWEETVRLRERMFWSRIAGGVVPLVNAPVPSQTEPEIAESSIIVHTGNEKNHYLHPTDNAVLELNSVEVSPRSEIPQPIPPETSFRDHEVVKPMTPELPEFDPAGIEDSADEALQRRGSVDSDASIYEEANAKVADGSEEADEDQLPAIDEQEDTEAGSGTETPVVHPQTSSHEHEDPEAKAELSEPAVQPPTPTHDDLSTEAGTDAVRDTTEQAKSTQEADKIEINVHNSS